jgi:hypothetical protein
VAVPPSRDVCAARLRSESGRTRDSPSGASGHGTSIGGHPLTSRTSDRRDSRRFPKSEHEADGGAAKGSQLVDRFAGNSGPARILKPARNSLVIGIEE